MNDDIENWPTYLPGPPSHLKALGVISLTYGHLEGMFQALFSYVTNMSEEHVAALFQRIPNNIRTKMMLELMEKTKIPKNLKALVQYFADGFTMCADNRHGLMHSHSGGIMSGITSGHFGFVFTKTTRAGNRQVCTPSAGDLKRVADSMHEYAMFAASLGMAIHTARTSQMPEDSTWLPPLLDKPSPPQILLWHEEATFLASQNQRPTFLM